MESKDSHRPDMPEFLAALDNSIVKLNQLRVGTPSLEQVDDALRTHIKMLDMFRDMKHNNMKLREQDGTEGEVFTNAIEALLGKDSSVAHYNRGLSQELLQSCSDLTKIDI